MGCCRLFVFISSVFIKESYVIRKKRVYETTIAVQMLPYASAIAHHFLPISRYTVVC